MEDFGDAKRDTMSEDTGKDTQEDAPAMEESSNTAAENEVVVFLQPRHEGDQVGNAR